MSTTIPFETRGSAVATGVLALSSSTSYMVQSTLYVTNVSGADVSCKVTFYDQDGNDMSSILSVYSGNNSGVGNTTISTGNAPFSLPAGNTRSISTYKTNLNKRIMGHAVIEWSSENGTIRKALIAEGRRITSSGSNSAYGSTITVNGGQPF